MSGASGTLDSTRPGCETICIGATAPNTYAAKHSNIHTPKHPHTHIPTHSHIRTLSRGATKIPLNPSRPSLSPTLFTHPSTPPLSYALIKLSFDLVVLRVLPSLLFGAVFYTMVGLKLDLSAFLLFQVHSRTQPIHFEPLPNTF